MTDARVATHPAIAVPLTMGVRRPMIALPDAWHAWTDEALDAVLAHEQAHIRRHDTRSTVIVRIAVACFWFNPLMWLGLRRLTALAEFAADDDAARVSGPRRYARHLLAVASGAPAGPRLELAAGARSNLEARIEALLQAGRTGAVCRRGPALLPALVAAALIVAGLFTVSMEAGPGWMDDHAASHTLRHGRH
jgi:beta-lactamase regulating signal transducer with metallopeptidase domain